MYKVITRKSNLALIQAKEAASLIGLKSSDYELVKIDSCGDKNKDIPLDSDAATPDFFTKELNVALLEGKGDWAVHSAKDLEYPLARGLKVVALTPCVDNREAVVTRGDIPFLQLKKDSTIGTCSASRKVEILKIRPDLNVKSIRGTIEERIEQVDDGKYDAVVVALCALKRLGLENRISAILDIPSHSLQGYLAVVAKDDRLDIEHKFAGIDVRHSWGKVYIVGAGVGGYDNLTVRVARLIERCDTAFYDDLISDDIKNCLGQKGIYVGKRAGKPSEDQRDIEKQMLKYAREGKTVLRLKCGDPYVFGRGGEEVEYLLSNFIKVEVIAGVTSALTAASCYKIPLTMRGVSRSVAFATASFAGDSEIFVPNSDTIVFYMGGQKCSQIREAIVKKSDKFSGDTPVAILSNVGNFSSSVIRTSVSNMDDFSVILPAIVVVGESVNRMVEAKKMLYTGLDPWHIQNKVDYEVVHCPLIETEAVEFDPLLAENFDTLVFTSSEAIKYFTQKAPVFVLRKSVVCIGKKTADAAKIAGFRHIYISPEPNSESLVEYIENELNFKNYLYPCSSLSQNMLHLSKRIVPVVVYKTGIKNVSGVIDLNFFDAVYFSSPSTVDAFAYNFKKNFPKNIKYYSIGKFTTQKLSSFGVEYVFESY